MEGPIGMTYNMVYGLLAVIIVSVLVRFTLLAIASHRHPPPTLSGGMLKTCPATPNCVCSEPSGGDNAIAPLHYTGDATRAWQRLSGTIARAGGTVHTVADGYLWATFTTPLFRYVDDVEARLDEASSVIHIRSASRVGYSDFGANRKRVERLRRLFEARTG